MADEPVRDAGSDQQPTSQAEAETEPSPARRAKEREREMEQTGQENVA